MSLENPTIPFLETLLKDNVQPSNFTEKEQTLLDSVHRLAEDYAASVDWELLRKVFPCLNGTDMTPAYCSGCNAPCPHRLPLKLLDDILLDAKILSLRGGIYLDRLVTAKSFGVPWEIIEKSPRINVPAIVEILSRYGIDPHDFMNNV